MSYASCCATFGSAGLGSDRDAIPSGFAFPTQGEYVQALVGALDQMLPAVGAKPGSTSDVLTPPVQVQVSGLVAALESPQGAGIPFRDLVGLAGDIAALTQATNPAQISHAVATLIDDGASIATDVAEAAGAAGDVLSTIPMIGRIVGMAVGFLLDGFYAEARYKQYAAECQQRIDTELNGYCSSLVSDATPFGTGAEGVTPADMFRPVAYAWQKRERPPLSPASVYVALCAKQTQGWLTSSRSKIWLSPNNKIPASTQRKMWSLCKGIMTAIRDPHLGAAPTDQGRALYPMLLDIILNEHRAGRLTEAAMREQADAVAAAYRIEKDCPDLSSGEAWAGAMPYGAGSCSDRVDLFTPVYQTLVRYEAMMIDEFQEPPGSGHWTARPKTKLQLKPTTLVLDMDAGTSNQLLDNVAAVFRESYYPPFSALKSWQKLLLVAGVAGAGYLGYDLMARRM